MCVKDRAEQNKTVLCYERIVCDKKKKIKITNTVPVSKNTKNLGELIYKHFCSLVRVIVSKIYQNIKFYINKF